MGEDQFIPQWARIHRRYLLALVDGVLVALALALAYFIRGLDIGGWDLRYGHQYQALVPAVVILQIALFALFHLYRGLLRYAGIAEVKVIVLAATLMAFGIALLNAFYLRIPALWLGWPVDPGDGAQPAHILKVPNLIIVTNWMLTILLVGGFRFSRRLLLSTFRRREGKNVIVIGIEAGEPAAREMLRNPADGYDPVGFISPNPLHAGHRIHGLPVLGTLTELATVIREYAVEEVVIALPEATGREIREITDICRAENAQAKILPSVSKIMSGQVSVSAIRPVTIEDILGREPVELTLPENLNYIRGRRILVTGAGGSIGSEIVRQTLRLEPAMVVLLGRGENSLFEVAAELGIGYRDPRFPLVVGNVRDRAKMRHVFETYRPHAVFHAAAHKHVPFMETNPEEAIKNNVIGTRIVAELAAEFGVERFILISTDKAVRPVNIMGASKRITEMIAWDVAARSTTRFVAVRFGNVLGSRGSVVPILKRQIAAGGPVTITHRDMTRYFMTIPEAASLVVQAGALGDGNGRSDSRGNGNGPGDGRGRGRLFVLDMGEPVKIVDLIHNLILLSGFRPGQDIEIQEIGPRPGEKVHEELLTADETVKATQFGKIFITQPDVVDAAALRDALARLERAADACDEAAIRAIIQELIPDFRPQPAP